LHTDTATINKSLKNAINGQIKFKELAEQVDLFISNVCDRAADFKIHIEERNKMFTQIAHYRDEVEALVRSFRAKIAFMLRVMDNMRLNLTNKDFLESAFFMFDVND